MSGAPASEAVGDRDVAAAGAVDALDRWCVKIPVAQSTISDEAEVFVPIFHEWIRDNALDLVALDVADYAHVPDGPGIMLICHEVNFALDRSDGSFGLFAQRRIDFDGSAADALATTIRQALDIASRLEAHDLVAGGLTFDASRLRIEVNDRLLAPNSDEGYQVLAPVVEEAITAVFGQVGRSLERVDNDPRDRLAIAAGLDSSGNVQDHARALTATPPGGSVRE